LPERLASALREAVATGRIAAGSPFPSERRLAADNGVSRTTVGAALDQLEATGWAERRVRARAAARLPGPDGQPLAPVVRPGARIGAGAARIAAPAEPLRRAMVRATGRITSHLLGDGMVPRGLDELRAAVAARFEASGLATGPSAILITNGAMGAFNALVDASTGPVVVEDPTYHVALALLRRRRRRLVPWPRGAAWDVAELERLVRRARPSMAYLVADFHNPTGRLASDGERVALAAAADGIDLVVVDETLRALDLREPGTPMPRLLAAHRPDVVTIGGLSKTVWSGLRVGWMRVTDPERRATLAPFAELQPVPLFEQLVALELWPELDAVIGERLVRLRRQRDVLVAAAHEHGLAVEAPPGGLVCWIDLGRPVAPAVVTRLAACGVAAASGARFGAAQPFDRFVRLPFTLEPPALVDAVDLLAREARAGSGTH
jgi:DNA-binding transcriptional MocR family regulator